MELRHLRYFLVLADELHFGRAAKKLFIAQPPLSRQIKNLEEDLGVELFKRTKRNVQLTVYGHYLRQEAARVFRHIESMRRHLGLLKRGVVGQIRIGYVGSAMHSVLPNVLSKLKEAFPEINTSLYELGNQDQIDALRSGQIDIGFVRKPLVVEDACVHTIYTETLSVVLPQLHPLAEAEKLDLADLAEQPFISFCRECAPGLFDTIIGVCNKRGFSPKIVHETSQINSVIRLVESNLGYSIVPTSVKHGYAINVKFFELTNVVERAELALVYRQDGLTPTSEKVVDLILEGVHPEVLVEP